MRNSRCFYVETNNHPLCRGSRYGTSGICAFWHSFVHQSPSGTRRRPCRRIHFWWCCGTQSCQSRHVQGKHFMIRYAMFLNTHAHWKLNNYISPILYVHSSFWMELVFQRSRRPASKSRACPPAQSRKLGGHLKKHVGRECLPFFLDIFVSGPCFYLHGFCAQTAHGTQKGMKNSQSQHRRD